ncbi:hypothetical protein [Pseudonocardia asaccharolytica]|uniref:Rieske domain-containing protein n=1 Tax=Pseudonocardia asaccharolytica DSM 44247 = NBRC 16224 TaxID=1123024 RepID=A0A511D3B6_9PSEU|nr:hypothetical protein [Pseudonocardia asaccharolytica]GEL18084.1 hypothetical protein PA7_19210 [Pseudonocardia asaccharolytica DSM 44247 = NBRC 16224]
MSAALRELALEDERIWTRAWVCVGVEQQIPGLGDLLPATVGHHGLHVQRGPDGGLRAGFNVLQYGSCWTIPAQCGHGHKTNCPYVSCAHSLDTDAVAADDGVPTRQMRQFIGFNPQKLADVPVRTVGPLIFVTLADPPPLEEQLGALGAAAAALGGLRHVARFWAELDCNWKLAGDALFEALGAPPRSGRLVERLAAGTDVPGTMRGRPRAADAGAPLAPDDGGVRLWRAFPNVVLVCAPDHAATVVVKPTRIDGVALVISLFARRGDAAGGVVEEGADEEAAALAAGWRAVAREARARSRSARMGDGSPILTHARSLLGG